MADGETLADASVRIIADFDSFEPEVKRRLREAVKSAADQAEKDFDKAGARSGKAYSDALGRTIKASSSLDDVADSARGLQSTTEKAARGMSKALKDPETVIRGLENAVTQANDSMADSTGRVRIAQAQLTEAKKKYGDESSRVLVAEENLRKAQRGSVKDGEKLAAVTRDLTSARERLAAGLSLPGLGDPFGGSGGAKIQKSAAGSGDDAGGFFSRSFEKAASKAVGQALFRIFAAGAASIVTAASPLSTVLGGAAAAVVALAAAVSQASGAVLSLGGVLGALGLAGAAATVGFQGVGDAVKAETKALAELSATGKVSEATQKKLDAALKNLAPSARAVVVALGQLSPAWTKVRTAVQQNLFAGAAAEIKSLAGTFLPLLQAQLGTAATSLATTGGALVKFLTSAQGQAQITAIFAGLNQTLATLLPIATTLAPAFLLIFQASLPFAQQLATVLASLSTSFAGFLTASVSSGAFTTFMQTAMTLAGQLFTLLGNIGSIIGSVFGAGTAAGGDLLSILVTLTGTLATFLNSDTGKTALASFFGLIGQAAGVLVGIFQTLQPLLSGIGALFAGLQGPIQALGTALQPVIAQLAGTLGAALGQLAPILGTLVSALIPVVTILGGTLNGLLSALLPVILGIVSSFAQLVPVLTPIISLLGAGLVSVIQQIAPLFLQLLPVLVQFIAAIATGIQPVVAALVPVLVQLVGAAIQILSAFVQLLPALLPLIPPLAQLSLSMTQLVLALLPVILAFANVAAVTLGTLAPALTAIVGFIVPVITSFSGIIDMVTRVVAAVAGFVANVLNRFAALRSGGASQIQAMIGAIIGAVGPFVARVVSFFASLVSQALAKLSGWAAAARSAVVGVASAILGALKSGLSGIGSTLVGYGRDAVNGFVQGLEGALGKVRDVASKIASAVTGPVAKLLNINSPSKVMHAMGGDTVQGYINGVRERLPALRAALTQLASAVPGQVQAGIGKVATALKSLGTALTSGQRTKLNQFIATAQTGIASLERAGTTVANKLKAANAQLADLMKQAQQFATSVANSVLQTGNITQGQDTSFSGIVKNLANAVTNARQFQSVLASLSKAGLNKTALQQIAEAGPDQGTAVGKSILAAGKAGIAQVNKLQGELQTAANKAANTAAAALFGQGIKVAQGIVAGLQKQKTQLDAEMTRLGDVLVARVLRLLRTTKVNSAGTLTIPGFSNGGLATQPSMVAENYRPEVVIPLTKPKRRDQLLDKYFGGWADQRAWDGGGGYGSSKRVELHVPIQAGTVVDPQGLVGMVNDEFERRFGSSIGIDTAGGRL